MFFSRTFSMGKPGPVRNTHRSRIPFLPSQPTGSPTLTIAMARRPAERPVNGHSFLGDLSQLFVERFGWPWLCGRSPVCCRRIHAHRIDRPIRAEPRVNSFRTWSGSSRSKWMDSAPWGARHIKPRFHIVNSKHSSRTEVLSARNREEADRPASEDGNRVRWSDLRHHRRHIRGGQDVGHQHRLVVGNFLGQLNQIHSSEWNPRELCLQAVEAACRLRTAKKHRARIGPVRVGDDALRVIAGATVIATATANSGWNNHSVPLAQVADGFTNLFHDSYRFMSQNPSFLDAGKGSANEVQICSADCAGGDADNRIGCLLDLRIGDALDRRLRRPRDRQLPSSNSSGLG